MVEAKPKFFKLVQQTVTVKNKNSQLVHSVDEVLELLLRRDVQGEIVVDDTEEIDHFRKYQSELSGTVTLCEQDLSDNFHETKTNEWNIPDEYLSIDVEKYLLERCNSEQEVERVLLELNEFNKRGLGVVLNLMIYLVDHFRENNIVWGVGRGSSAASYCLYLIGINRVNSLEYELDIKEFFK